MNYRESLVELLKSIKPQVGVEVGVHKGRLSEFLLGVFPELTLHMIDPYLEDKQYPNQEDNKKLAMQRTLRFGDRARRVYGSSEYGAEMFRQGQLEADFVFIDADHEEMSVMEDMRLWYPHVSEGGMFCGHDFLKDDIPGVTKAVRKWEEITGLQVNSAEGNIWWMTK